MGLLWRAGKINLQVVHVNTQDVAGGAAKMARLLSAHQRLLGFNSQMLVSRRHGSINFVKRFDPEPFPVIGPFCDETGLEYLHFQGAFKLLQKEPMASTDLIHLHNLHYGFFNPLALPSITRSKPCIWTLHDLHPFTGFCNYPVDCMGWCSGCVNCTRKQMNTPDPRLDGENIPLARRMGTAINYQVRSLIYQHSNLTLTCPSYWVKAQVEKSNLAGHPIHVIPNGIETEIFVPYDKATARNQLNIPHDALVIGGAAAYGVFANPIKNRKLILDALKRVWNQNPRAIFLNVGGFDTPPDPRVINIPFVEDTKKLSRIYSAMDVFVHTSMAETFCLVAVEAMSCGIPVVAQRLGPLPEVVRHEQDGLLSSPGDADGLAHNIICLLKNASLRHQMGKNGRKRALSEFGIELMVSRYSKLYDHVLKEWPRTPTCSALPFEQLPALVKTPALASAEGNKIPHKTGDELVQAFLNELSDKDRPIFSSVFDKINNIRQVFTLREQCKLEESFELLSALNKKWPEDTALWRTRGVTLGLMKRHDEAMAAFQICLDAYPAQSDVWLNIFDMWRSAGNIKKAVAALDSFASIDPYLRGYNWRRGLLFQDKGQHRNAVQMFIRELRLHGSTEARDALLKSLKVLGKVKIYDRFSTSKL